jgi:hypothetical protein
MIRHHQGAIDIVATENRGREEPTRTGACGQDRGILQQNEVTELKNVGGV